MKNWRMPIKVGGRGLRGRRVVDTLVNRVTSWTVSRVGEEVD